MVMHKTCIGTIKVVALAADKVYNNRELIFKDCVPFTDCISEINNTQTLM